MPRKDNFPVVLPGADLRRAMRRHNVTIAELARKMGLSQQRVRSARADGVRCYGSACDWWGAITGVAVWNRTLADWLEADPLRHWHTA